MITEPREYKLGNGNGLHYAIDVNFGRAVIVGSYGKIIDLEIPSSIESVPVTEIVENSFIGQRDLARVFIPKTVESIGENAFANCSSLKNVFIPDETEFVAYTAFSKCHEKMKFHCNIGSCAHYLAQVRNYITEPLTCMEAAKSVFEEEFPTPTFSNPSYGRQAERV